MLEWKIAQIRWELRAVGQWQSRSGLRADDGSAGQEKDKPEFQTGKRSPRAPFLKLGQLMEFLASKRVRVVRGWPLRMQEMLARNTTFSHHPGNHEVNCARALVLVYCKGVTMLSA